MTTDASILNQLVAVALERAAAHSETLSVEDAAALMRLGVDATQELITLGEIPAASLNRKHWVLLRSDVLDYIKKLARRQQMERLARQENKGPEVPRVLLPVQPPKVGRPRNIPPALS